MTGKYPHNHEVKSVLSNSNGDRTLAIKGAWEAFQLQEDKTIAKWLKEDAGYTNGIIGKFFHGYGKNGVLRNNEIPVFWACGVTPQSVLESSKPDFCITHHPGKMLITDKLNTDLAAL